MKSSQLYPDMIPTNIIPVCSYSKVRHLFVTFQSLEPLQSLDFVGRGCYNEWGYNTMPTDAPYLTSSGICSTFNSSPIQKVFKPSSILDSFTRIFVPTSDEPRMPTGFGPESGFFMLLDTHGRNQPITEKATTPKRRWNFKVAINDPKSAFDSKRRGIRVKPGYRTTIKVVPSQVIATPQLKGLAVSERQCRMSDETDGLKFVEEYSQNACQFECALSKSLEQCLCKPWNYPWSDKEFLENVTLCDMYGNYCFFQSMSKVCYLVVYV